mmetsp:Transcript_154263/g.268740  ORF Transcript_154263/g.268740 Transcript_154263/m.268740 type:complete len:130 (+) Transcript_154263:2529-2918(+)
MSSPMANSGRCMHEGSPYINTKILQCCLLSEVTRAPLYDTIQIHNKLTAVKAGLHDASGKQSRRPGMKAMQQASGKKTSHGSLESNSWLATGVSVIIKTKAKLARVHTNPSRCSDFNDLGDLPTRTPRK